MTSRTSIAPWKSHARTHWQREYADDPNPFPESKDRELVAACHVHKRPSTGFPVSRFREYVTCKACLYQMAMCDGVKTLRKRRNPMCPKCRQPKSKDRANAGTESCAVCLQLVAA